MTKYVYLFKEGNASMRNLLGGKGANLAEMTKIGLPVPQGFTVSTEACTRYYEDGKTIGEDIVEQIYAALAETEKVCGKKFGDLENPFLVSVRSGARASMPGMMDTILNLGLNDVAVKGLANLTENERFAYDSYRRFIQMFSDVVMEIPKSFFERVLDEIKESEGIDRADMKLAENQLELLAAVAAANPNVVVLLSAGSSLESDWVKDCKALVYGCLGGQAGAGALVEVLTGAQNPCGKLAETWARSYADTPAKAHFGGDGPTVEYREGLYVGYRYYDTAGVPTAFPFGYGLSYTSFAYSDLKADETGVTLTVTNTGSCAGAEVVQLYVAKPDAKVFRPVKELKGFAKVQLEAGESKTVTIPLDDKAFRYWNVKTDRWEVEGGSYQLLVGASSADIRLTAAVTVAGTGAPDPYAGKNLEHYRTAQVQNVPDAEFEALLGRPIPENKVHIDRNMTLGEMGHGRSPIGWLAAAVLGTLLRRSIKKGKPDLNILFQYNMPLRALAKMTNGAISMGMVDGIVMELQGFWIIGLVRVIVEAVKNLVLNSRMEERLKNS